MVAFREHSNGPSGRKRRGMCYLAEGLHAMPLEVAFVKLLVCGHPEELWFKCRVCRL